MQVLGAASALTFWRTPLRAPFERGLGMVSYPGSVPSSVNPGISSSGFRLTHHNHLTKVSDAGCLEHHTHGNQGTQGAEEVDIWGCFHEEPRSASLPGIGNVKLTFPRNRLRHHYKTPLFLTRASPSVRLQLSNKLSFLCFLFSQALCDVSRHSCHF
jgi:hypothetical protein